MNAIQYDSHGRMKYDPEFHTNHKKPWTTHDQKYLIEFYNGANSNDISMALGRTVGTILDKVCTLRKQKLMPPANKKVIFQ
jgi:hypothetical protein